MIIMYIYMNYLLLIHQWLSSLLSTDTWCPKLQPFPLNEPPRKHSPSSFGAIRGKNSGDFTL